MSKIRIKNFGPIVEGLVGAGGDGFMEIRKFTVFIGNQGTGKSSVTKLISTLSWLEKALYRGELKGNHVTSYNRFVKEYCNYQNLKSYFKPDTEIEYFGEAYHFLYANGRFEVAARAVRNAQPGNFKVPQIMYVPAERNFLSAVDYPDKLKGLPKSLSTFWQEMQKSLQELSAPLVLPVGDAKLEYNKSSKITRVVGRNYTIRLSEASSGFQSYVPLFLVSHNLANSIGREKDTSKNERSSEELRRIREEVEKIISNQRLSKELKDSALQLLSNKLTNDTFLNIVEEIEQNLYPSSQKMMLFRLIEFANQRDGNGLILTTHSPYIINYLTVAIKAGEVYEKINSSGHQELKDELGRIVPVKSVVSAEQSIVYELNEDGSIKILETYRGLPSDENYLNEILQESNELFTKLLELEDLCR